MRSVFKAIEERCPLRPFSGDCRSWADETIENIQTPFDLFWLAVTARMKRERLR